MKTPTISVVITHYNEPEALRECIKRWKAQNPHEIIVVDDGSSGEAALCALLIADEHEGCRYYRMETNQGVSVAMSIGRSLATGDYVHYASCTDECNPRFIQVHTASLEQCDTLPDVQIGMAKWHDTRTGVSWLSRYGENVSHAAVFKRFISVPTNLECHCDWYMKRSAGVVRHIPFELTTINLRRGQYSDVKRFGSDYQTLLANLIDSVEALPTHKRDEAVRDSWLADFGAAGLLALAKHRFRRVFWTSKLLGKALLREAEIQGRRHLPAWAQQIALMIYR